MPSPTNSASLVLPGENYQLGYWGSIGIIKDAFYRERMASAGIGSIEPADGMAALHTLLN